MQKQYEIGRNVSFRSTSVSTYAETLTVVALHSDSLIHNNLWAWTLLIGPLPFKDCGLKYMSGVEIVATAARIVSAVISIVRIVAETRKSWRRSNDVVQKGRILQLHIQTRFIPTQVVMTWMRYISHTIVWTFNIIPHDRCTVGLEFPSTS